jgi:hypothetical protein
MLSGRSFSDDYLKTYFMCKEFRCLPYEGGYLDQPAKYIEAFEIIDQAIFEYKRSKEEAGRLG